MQPKAGDENRYRQLEADSFTRRSSSYLALLHAEITAFHPCSRFSLKQDSSLWLSCHSGRSLLAKRFRPDLSAGRRELPAALSCEARTFLPRPKAEAITRENSQRTRFLSPPNALAGGPQKFKGFPTKTFGNDITQAGG